MTEAGLVDPAALWRADAAALADRSYVAVVTINGSRLGEGGNRRTTPPAASAAR